MAWHCCNGKFHVPRHLKRCSGNVQLNLAIFTVRKRSLRRLCFYRCLSFCPWGCLGPYPGGGWGSSWGGPQAHTRKGLQAHTQGGLQAQARGVCVYPSMHWGRHPPPPADGYCCGRYASYWNAFLFIFLTRTPLLCYDDLYVTVIEKLYINHIVYFFYNVV